MAGSSVPSAKALQTTRLVVENKDRAWSARFNLQSPLMTIDPNTNVTDIYGRNAHPYSLNQSQPNGTWNSPYYNLPQFLIVENNVHRPWIDYSMNPGYQYDTLGVGRASYNRTFPNAQFPVYRGMAANSPTQNPCSCVQQEIGQQRVMSQSSGCAGMTQGFMFSPTYTG